MEKGAIVSVNEHRARAFGFSPSAGKLDKPADGQEISALSPERAVKQSLDRIFTTHVGSLPRPKDLLDLMKEKVSGLAYDKAAYDRRVKTGEWPVPRTATPLSFPAFTCGRTVGMVAKSIEVWPPNKSVIAGTLPL